MLREFELETRRLTHENDIKSKQMKNDFKVKSMAAGLKPQTDSEGNEKLAITMDTDQLSDAVERMAESTKQSNEVMLKAIASLTDAVTRPRKLITDGKGRPIGSSIS